jgi:hypothetical protein
MSNLIVINTNDFNDLVYDGEEEILKNNLIFTLEGQILNKPTRTSIQIDENGMKHINDEYGQYMNHSCDPTCYIKDESVYSSKNIKKGTSLTFNYNVSENVMSNSFNCNCCNKLISGKYPNR